MKSIVQEALKDTKKEKLLSQSFQAEDIYEDSGNPQIVFCGCGGAGNNTINRFYNLGLSRVKTIAINTDKQHLDKIQADIKILTGKTLTRGLGAGGCLDVGRKAAELARDTLEEVFKGADIVFITAGMGGGTGTGTVPVVAEIARMQSAIVIGIVSTPFRVERARSIKKEIGLQELYLSADTVVILDNNRLLDYVPNLPIEQAFSVMDQLICEAVNDISETITQPSLINSGYVDIRAIIGKGGKAVMLVGEAKNYDRADAAVRAALNHPLHDADYRKATGCLIHITGGPDLILSEAAAIAQALTYELDGRANIIWSARINTEYEDRIRVLGIMTGILH